MKYREGGKEADCLFYMLITFACIQRRCTFFLADTIPGFVLSMLLLNIHHIHDLSWAVVIMTLPIQCLLASKFSNRCSAHAVFYLEISGDFTQVSNPQRPSSPLPCSEDHLFRLSAVNLVSYTKKHQTASPSAQ